MRFHQEIKIKGVCCYIQHQGIYVGRISTIYDTYNFTLNFALTQILKNGFRNRIIRKLSKVYVSCQFGIFNLEGFHIEVKAKKTHKIFPKYHLEAYLEPSQTSTMELFYKNSYWLKGVNYFRRKFYSRCSTGLLIHLWH